MKAQVFTHMIELICMKTIFNYADYLLPYSQQLGTTTQEVTMHCQLLFTNIRCIPQAIGNESKH